MSNDDQIPGPLSGCKYVLTDVQSTTVMTYFSAVNKVLGFPGDVQLPTVWTMNQTESGTWTIQENSTSCFLAPFNGDFSNGNPTTCVDNSTEWNIDNSTSEVIISPPFKSNLSLGVKDALTVPGVDITLSETANQTWFLGIAFCDSPELD